MKITHILIVILFLFCAVTCFGQATAVLPYSGRLHDAETGGSVDAVVDLTFRIYNAHSGGTALWIEPHWGVAVIDGVFSVRLGKTTPLSGLSFAEPYYISIQVGEDVEMSPRLPLTSSPYSLAALWGEMGPPGPTGLPETYIGDLEVIGSLGCGDGGETPQTYGFASLLMRDDTPRITFDDTSSTEGFANNDWEIRCNDTGAGESYFSIVDLGAGTTPWNQVGTRVFTIEPGATNNAFYIDGSGNVGLGTPTPAADLHVARPLASAASILVQSASSQAAVSAKTDTVEIGSLTEHDLELQANGTTHMTLYTDGTIQMSDGGGYDGTWYAASSRRVKQDIAPLSLEEALQALDGLQAVRYRYRKTPADEHVGFIAEEVPDLVASPGRENISSLDIVAVLTRVVQDQQKSIIENRRAIDGIRKRIERLEDGL